MRKLKFIDLFCGCGGFSLGFKKAGFEHIFGLDNNQDACEVYEKNIGKSICMNIEDFNGKEYNRKIDVLIGSPPCQKMSYANFQNRDVKLGMNLVRQFMRVVDEIKPKVWIWENVKGIFKNMDKINRDKKQQHNYHHLYKKENP